MIKCTQCNQEPGQQYRWCPRCCEDNWQLLPPDLQTGILRSLSREDQAQAANVCQTWDKQISPWRFLGTFPSRSHNIAISPDGRLLAIVEHTRVNIWDIYHMLDIYLLLLPHTLAALVVRLHCQY